MVKNKFKFLRNSSLLSRFCHTLTALRCLLCVLSLSHTHSELNPPLPFASRLLNTRTMKETFRSFVELLISIALDEDVMTALERANGEQDTFWTLFLVRLA